jgi:threonine dehydrogenase-like Zn-dependent dehydrogenase
MFGADAVISIEDNPDPMERRKLVLEQTGSYGADTVIECAGHPGAVPEGLELCRDGGRYLVLGQYANAGEVPLNPHVITRKQLQVAGSWGFEPRHVDQALRLLDNTDWKRRFACQITDRFPLSQANEALDHVHHWRGGKTVIVP